MRNKELGMMDKVAGFGLLGILAIIFLGALSFGLPEFNRYQRLQTAENEKQARLLDGEAELAEAEQTRQVKIAEAKAKLEAAKYLADAEVERAKGVKAANAIIAEGLGGPEGYLRYLWIQALQDDSNSVIYVPTEASLPILEAGKR